MNLGQTDCSTDTNSYDTARARRMGIVARAPYPDLDEAFNEWGGHPNYGFLRPPETGLIMVRGRAGGSGTQFNMGEVTVTRCVVKLDTGTVGYGYVQGRGHRQAEIAALFDAVLSADDASEEPLLQIIEELAQGLEARRLAQSRKVAATKVEFFTVARNEVSL